MNLNGLNMDGMDGWLKDSAHLLKTLFTAKGAAQHKGLD